MLLIKAASIWIFLLAVSSRPNRIGREIKNAVFVSTSSLLKKIADLWNCELPPLLESIRSLVQLALHMRRCGMLQLVSACSAYTWLVEDAKHVLVLIPCKWNAGWLCTHRCAHNLPPRRVIGSHDSCTLPVHSSSEKTHKYKSAHFGHYWYNRKLKMPIKVIISETKIIFYLK